MASNSLFSSVTPCQQNFFWGEYCDISAPICRARGLLNDAGDGYGNKKLAEWDARVGREHSRLGGGGVKGEEAVIIKSFCGFMNEFVS